MVAHLEVLRVSIRTSMLTLCLSLLLAGPAAAGRAKPPGKFALLIAPTDSTESIDQWISTPVRKVVPLHRMHEIARGRTAHVAFIVTGHVPGPDRLARVDVDVSLRRPDGLVAYTKASFGRLKGWECLAVGYAMADPTLELSPDPTDLLGEWRIEAVAHDRISGATATASYPITFKK
jgi:hypothetical protein